MALTVKSLIATSLPISTPNTASTYSPTTGKGAVVKSILFVNTVSGVRTVTATLTKGGGSPVNICPPGLSVPAQSSISLDVEITLSDSDALKFYANNSGVDCVVSGMERDN